MNPLGYIPRVEGQGAGQRQHVTGGNKIVGSSWVGALAAIGGDIAHHYGLCQGAVERQVKLQGAAFNNSVISDGNHRASVQTGHRPVNQVNSGGFISDVRDSGAKGKRVQFDCDVFPAFRCIIVAVHGHSEHLEGITRGEAERGDRDGRVVSAVLHGRAPCCGAFHLEVNKGSAA